MGQRDRAQPAAGVAALAAPALVTGRVEPLLGADAIRDRVNDLAGEIQADYAGRRPLFVIVMLGAFVFASDLLRHWQEPVEVASVVMSSYPVADQRRRPRLVTDLATDIAGRDLVILEDIVDSGRTLQVLCRRLTRRGPASIAVAALLDKPAARQAAVPLHYAGFQIPNAFVVGYGLDWSGLYRNLPYVGVIDPA